MIITHYGRHWNRQLTDWKFVQDHRCLEGTGPDGTFNVFERRGIYLLHDYTLQPVYVGQAGGGERPMGPRVLEHCRDHLWGSWHFYSWFAVAASKEGDGLSIGKMLNELEDLLIYLLVPRLNRKRGINEGAIEVTQKFVKDEGVFSPFPIYAEVEALSKRIEKLEGEVTAAKRREL